MARVALTEKAISAARAAPGQRLELWDALSPGLCLRVTEKGAKTWIFRYRALDGSQPRHRLGDTSNLTLKAARLEAGRLKDLVGGGRDPHAEAAAAKAKAQREALATFDKLLDAYWAACERGEWQPKRKIKRASTLAYEKRLAARHISPVLGRQPIAGIRRATIKDLLRDMLARRIGSQTNRVQALIRQVFNYAIAEDLTELNPAMGFRAFHASKPRRRIWKDHELRALWTGLTACGELRTPDGERRYIGRPVRIALQLCAILLQRRAEIAGMDLAEVDFEQALWTLPPERMKGGRPHLVPLPPYALVLIQEAIALSGLPRDRLTGPVFPSPGDATKPLNSQALTRAMDRLRDCIGVEDAHVHDLRRTGSTALTSERLRVSPFIRSKVLGHETDSGGGASVSSVHYDVNEYLSDKRAALCAWESLLLRIVENEDRPRKRMSSGLFRTMVFGLEAANDEVDRYMAISPKR